MGIILTFNSDTSEWEAPAETAETTQDIKITDAAKGIVLTNANGEIWRVTLQNDGTLLTTNITPQ